MKRVLIGFTLVAAILVAAYVFFRFFYSLPYALAEAGLSADDILVLERGFNANDREYSVVKTSKDGYLALAYLEKNPFGLWTVTNTTGGTPNEAHLVSIGWINNAGIRRFKVNEAPSFTHEWHILYYGDQAIQRIAIDANKLPPGIAVKIQQAESDFSIHLITYEAPEVLNQVDIPALLSGSADTQ